MEARASVVLLEDLRLEVEDDESVVSERVALLLGTAPEAVSEARVVRRSLDARRKWDVHWNLAVSARVTDARAVEKALLSGKARLEDTAAPEGEDGECMRGVPHGKEPLAAPPVIVGSGPGGLLAAFLLAREGYRPLVLERGERVEKRVRDLAAWDAGGPHDPESNCLFGEGGAGTFSDGKLTTRARTPLVRFLYELFVECKAPPDILVQSKPHIGTDRLRAVLVFLRKKLEQMGCEIRFRARVDDIVLGDDRRVQAVVLASGERLPAGALVLAIGHSARDTYEMLRARGVSLAFKPFQLGLRIEHPQDFIDSSQYGEFARTGKLGAAEYTLLAKERPGVPGAFSFCMCPGGQIMDSVSEPGHYGTNGMSRRARDSGWANSGIVYTVTAGETANGGRDPFDGLELQRRCEKTAFELGSGRYECPTQRVLDFLSGKTSRAPFKTSYPREHVAADLRTVLPPLGAKAIARALREFDARIRGYAGPSGILVGPESRGSSPVRIEREAETRESASTPGLFPVGEGAGFAGGIVSAAIDGLRSARALVRRYAPAR
ncbi:NAD(P)-binding protein [bacterium]|nr:NAD(P)-binding protein [bacterium]